MGIFSRKERPDSGASSTPEVALGGNDQPRMDALEASLGELRSELEETELRLEQRVAELASIIEDQNFAIAEGIERVDRAERRIKDTVRRAKARMARAGYVDDGLEAEADQLQLLDAPERPSQGVPPMSDDVEDDPPFDATGIPGDITPEILRLLG